ncbi:MULTISPECIES: hypothetical protein [Ruminococcus]|uniref:Lipocalin-like domain-containing protein n=1 Tax=Ruminococcus flavefaciens TaxID=1265 RepID=A0A1M7G501_RUMFL|nr:MULTISPECIES: hypothetical protein [Ruminococcus]MCR4794712.1 hypothetical protein [Ruminococcus sp.]SHM11266.1 hypothetical protein SAMN04487860_10161 [Ruminococcus flavefaciens]
MNKIMTFILSAVMLLLFLAGCGEKYDPKYIGKWEADYMYMDGEKTTDMLGMPLSALFRYEIKDGGKANWVSAVDSNVIQYGKNTEITWKETDPDYIQLTVTDLDGKEKPQTMKLHYREGMLTIEEDSTAIYLKKVDDFTPIDKDALNAAAGVIQNFGVNQ